MIKKISVYSFILILSAVLVFMLTACGGTQPKPEKQPIQGQAEKQVTLKLGHYFAADDFRGKTAQHFADLVAQKSQGSVKIQVFPAEQLVKGKEGFQSTVQGVVDLYPVLTTYIGGQVPVMNFFNLPFPPVKYTDDVMLKITEENKALLSKIFDANAVKMLGVINSTGASEFYFRAPVHVIADIQGKKMRGSGGLGDEAMKNLGTSVTFMSAAEQYLALQTGTVDGMSTTYSSYMSSKLYEVAPYWLRATIVRSPYFLLMNKAKWGSLSSNQQNALQEAMKETTQWSFSNYKAEEEKLMAEMRKRVKEEYTLPQTEWDQWFAKVQPLYNKYLQEAGPDGQQLMASREKLAK